MERAAVRRCAAGHDDLRASVGQPDDPAAEGHLPGVPHHHRRPHLPRIPDAPADDANVPDLRHGAGCLFLDVAGHRPDHQPGRPAFRPLASPGERTVTPTGAWDWGFAASILPQLLAATGYSVLATVLSFAGALALGLPLAIARDAKHRPLRMAASALVE